MMLRSRIIDMIDVKDIWLTGFNASGENSDPEIAG